MITAKEAFDLLLNRVDISFYIGDNAANILIESFSDSSSGEQSVDDCSEIGIDIDNDGEVDLIVKSKKSK